MKEQKEKSRQKKWWILLILLFLLLLLFLGYFLLQRDEQISEPLQKVSEKKDTLEVIEKIDTLPKIDTVTKKKSVKAIKKTITAVVPEDTVKKDTSDNLILLDEDSTDFEIADPCVEDTIAPWVFPDPSGGLHYEALKVRLKCTEEAQIFWKYKNEASWKIYSGRPIAINETISICYKATDKCGNKMAVKCEDYEIGERTETKNCPDDMVNIKMGTVNFCIDKYEWPNIKGKKPRANISIYQAQDSCFTKGKRLCKTEEWSLACAGVYSWKYAYGNKYESFACNTRDTTVYRSGMKPECRGYFEIYDMSGNLAEWTDTKSKKNPEFFNVMGGFWQSGSQSDCFTPRYSYYPQNHHNPVGFRCCKDVEVN